MASIEVMFKGNVALIIKDINSEKFWDNILNNQDTTNFLFRENEYRPNQIIRMENVLWIKEIK